MQHLTKNKGIQYFIYWVLFVLIFQSCQFIHLLNTKKPNNESKEEIDFFIKKRKYKFDKSFELNDSLSYLRKTDKYLISDSTKIASFIEVRVFDSSGRFYTGFSQCLGDFDKKFLVEMPIKKNNYPFLNQQLNFKNELDLIKGLDKNEKEVIIDKIKNHRYIIVVYWTIWTNHFSKKVLKEVSRYKDKYGDEVFVIFCNSAVD